MPPDRPGTLSRQRDADILAYIFAANQFPAGDRELSTQSETLKQIRFQSRATPGQPSQAAPRSAALTAPAPAMVEGQPIERRPPEKSDNQPAFPEQTRAPYHASAPFKVTTLIDNMPAPWSLAFLPSGKILLTERLPGSMRILDTKGVLSEPVAGVAELASPGAKDIGLLDVVLDPHFASQPPNLLHLFRFHRWHEQQYLCRAGPAG